MKRRGIICIAVVIFLFISALGGCNINKSVQEKRPSIVITKKELQEYENFRKQYYRQNISDADAKKALVEEKVLAKEAEKRKITVTKKEINSEVEMQKKVFENMNQQDRQYYTKMIKDKKISMDQYWKGTLPRALKKMLIKGKTKKAIKDEILKEIVDNKKLADKTRRVDLDKLYQNRIQDIIKKYEVTIK